MLCRCTHRKSSMKTEVIGSILAAWTTSSLHRINHLRVWTLEFITSCNSPQQALAQVVFEHNDYCPPPLQQKSNLNSTYPRRSMAIKWPSLTDHNIYEMVTVEGHSAIPASFDEWRSNKLDQASNLRCLLTQSCWPHLHLQPHHPLKRVNIRVNIFLHVVLAEEELHCLLPRRPD